MVDSRRESYFVIDTETLDVEDSAVVLDLSMVFVNMDGLFKLHNNANNFNPITFEAFIDNEFVKKISLFPSVKEQRALGYTVSKDTLKFWSDQRGEADEAYLAYIKKLFGENGKESIKEVVDKFEDFVVECVDVVPSNIQHPNDIYFMERSGGFDTNKYYHMLKTVREGNDTSNMKYWARREMRTIISCNRWRIPDAYLRRGTTSWSDEMREHLRDQVGNFTQHVAINDCLIDAYMVYLLKLSLENFYI